MWGRGPWYPPFENRERWGSLFLFSTSEKQNQRTVASAPPFSRREPRPHSAAEAVPFPVKVKSNVVTDGRRRPSLRETVGNSRSLHCARIRFASAGMTVKCESGFRHDGIACYLPCGMLCVQSQTFHQAVNSGRADEDILVDFCRGVGGCGG